jgi:M3 family oligoendopeptidase
MKFAQMIYRRPDMDQLKKQLRVHIEAFKMAETPGEQNTRIDQINRIRDDYDTMESICAIRHSIDTNDAYYTAEYNFFNIASPEMMGIVKDFYTALLNSKFKKELLKFRGAHYFNLAEVNLKAMADEIIEEMQVENQLVSEYNQLIASAQIEWKGEQLTLAQMGALMTDQDRLVRQQSHEKFFLFMDEHKEQLDDIYDQLVKIRHQMALKMGYQNYVEMGYARLGRTDYAADDVTKFREAVEKYITPISVKLKERQRIRLGLEKLAYYDQKFAFDSGNPIPIGSPEEMVVMAQEMYNQLSPETATFFEFMNENNLMDLVAKKGKEAGGYCTYIPGDQSPFIFSNFNGTHGDVTVLTHEFGHAFQVYNGKDYSEPEFIWPTLEAAEIASMSMEFITWPWMEKFFGEDTEKFKYMHLESAINFITYGVCVDEFQHRIYEQPEMTPDQRHQVWREIEKKYMPYADYSGNAYLEHGGYWQRQGHIYQVPFYYIDYTLAQIAALEIHLKFEKDREKTWEDYKRICKVSGSQSFTGILKSGNLGNPFHIETIRTIMENIQMELDTYNQTTF